MRQVFIFTLLYIFAITFFPIELSACDIMDIDDDGNTGIPEAIYALQVAAGMQNQEHNIDNSYFSGTRRVQVESYDITYPSFTKINTDFTIKVSSLPAGVTINRLFIHSSRSDSLLLMPEGYINSPFNVKISRNIENVDVLDKTDQSYYSRRGTQDNLNWTTGDITLNIDTENIYVITLQIKRIDNIIEDWRGLVKVGSSTVDYFSGIRMVNAASYEITYPATVISNNDFIINISSLAYGATIKRLFIHSFKSDASLLMPEGYTNTPFNVKIERNSSTIDVPDKTDQYYYSRRGTNDDLSWTTGNISLNIDTPNIYAITLQLERTDGIVENWQGLIKVK